MGEGWINKHTLEKAFCDDGSQSTQKVTLTINNEDLGGNHGVNYLTNY